MKNNATHETKLQDNKQFSQSSLRPFLAGHNTESTSCLVYLKIEKTLQTTRMSNEKLLDNSTRLSVGPHGYCYLLCVTARLRGRGWRCTYINILEYRDGAALT